MIGKMETWERLLLISAWNDSGGAFTHRLFDSHPELYCWPFEIQLGTEAAAGPDFPWLKGKFRWPVFPSPLPAPPVVFDQILDTELKGRLENPERSKFKGFNIRVSLSEWRQLFCSSLVRQPTRREIIKCYIKTFFEADRDYAANGQEHGVVGHCPNLIVDAERILADFPDSRILHIVRNPLAGIVDMRQRNPQLTAEEYGTRWNAINAAAATFQQRYPDRIRNVSLQNLVSDPRGVMSEICDWLELQYDDVLLTPTWRGTEIFLPGPFGGLSAAGADHEQACLRDLSLADRAALLAYTAEARQKLKLSIVTDFDEEDITKNGTE